MMDMLLSFFKGISRESCKQTHFLHPKGIRLEFCKLLVEILLDMKPLYAMQPELNFAEKYIFVCHIDRVKQSFVA